MGEDATTAVGTVEAVKRFDDAIVDEPYSFGLMRFQHAHKRRVDADRARRVSSLVLIEFHLRDESDSARRGRCERSREVGVARFVRIEQLDAVKLALFLFQTLTPLAFRSKISVQSCSAKRERSLFRINRRVLKLALVHHRAEAHFFLGSLDDPNVAIRTASLFIGVRVERNANGSSLLPWWFSFLNFSIHNGYVQKVYKTRRLRHMRRLTGGET